MPAAKISPENKPVAKKDYVFAVGRRKEAVARVRLHSTIAEDMVWGQMTIKKGDIVVNEKAIAEYFPGDVNRFKYTEPLRVANAQNKYTVTISVSGGGPSGQLDAVVNGLANALAKADSENFKPALRKQGFLTRDARIRERRKVGMGGKARRKKQSPKR
ncbi:MAG TPA: 30S ribosomal protein S9 [Patescibacteria group bacterium]|nr:30S ribosomal protein S9 [Patescibacteria group bacterium]